MPSLANTDSIASPIRREPERSSAQGRLHLDLSVDGGDIFEAHPRPVRRHHDRPIELGPAGAELPDDKGADHVGVGDDAAVRQALQPPREGDSARGEEAVAELENRKRFLQRHSFRPPRDATCLHQMLQAIDIVLAGPCVAIRRAPGSNRTFQ